MLIYSQKRCRVGSSQTAASFLNSQFHHAIRSVSLPDLCEMECNTL